MRPGRGHRVAASGLAILAGVLAVAAIGVDPFESWRHWRDIDTYRVRLDEIRQRIGAEAAVIPTLDALKAAEAAEPRLVAGETPEARAGSLRTLVDGIAGRHGFQAENTDRPVRTVEHGVEHLDLRRRGQIDAGALGGFLEAIETARPVLSVRAVTIGRVSDDDAGLLQIDLTIRAHGAPGPDAAAGARP